MRMIAAVMYEQGLRTPYVESEPFKIEEIEFDAVIATRISSASEIIGIEINEGKFAGHGTGLHVHDFGPRSQPHGYGKGCDAGRVDFAFENQPRSA
jgi:hypothetical protein